MAKSSGLPDVKGPLNVPAQPGDKLVPQNDMKDVGGEFAQGGKAPDPLGIVPKG